METSLKGTIVIIKFPFSDLSASKKRPALVIANWGSEDVILAQVTSIAGKDVYAKELKSEDFLKGSLMKTSFIRPDKLLTADKRMFLQIAGKITEKKIKEVINKIYEVLQL